MNRRTRLSRLSKHRLVLRELTDRAGSNPALVHVVRVLERREEHDDAAWGDRAGVYQQPTELVDDVERVAFAEAEGRSIRANVGVELKGVSWS